MSLELGAHLKKLRERKGLSMRSLAQLSGVSHPYISQLESGRNTEPSLKVIAKLAGPLGVSAAQLLTDFEFLEDLKAYSIESTLLGEINKLKVENEKLKLQLNAIRKLTGGVSIE